jgi:hypothetical protein
VGFVKDMAASKEAVGLLMDFFADQGEVVVECDKATQQLGDIKLERPDGDVYVEVKYDIMAKRTGNLCFELANNKGATGITTTGATWVYYVVPCEGTQRLIFAFETAALRSFLDTSKCVKIKNGGDGKRFTLAIVSIKDIIASAPHKSFFLSANNA